MSERDWQKDCELCQRATPGPWKALKGRTFVHLKLGERRIIEAPYTDMAQDDIDFSFIAESREALPYWLRRYKELHAKWIADTEEKIRLRYTNQQLQEELVRLKDIILQFARYADDHKVVLVCPEEASECNSLCSACWQAALDGRKEVKQDD